MLAISIMSFVANSILIMCRPIIISHWVACSCFTVAVKYNIIDYTQSATIQTIVVNNAVSSSVLRRPKMP